MSDYKYHQDEYKQRSEASRGNFRHNSNLSDNENTRNKQEAEFAQERREREKEEWEAQQRKNDQSYEDISDRIKSESNYSSHSEIDYRPPQFSDTKYYIPYKSKPVSPIFIVGVIGIAIILISLWIIGSYYAPKYEPPKQRPTPIGYVLSLYPTEAVWPINDQSRPIGLLREGIPKDSLLMFLEKKQVGHLGRFYFKDMPEHWIHFFNKNHPEIGEVIYSRLEFDMNLPISKRIAKGDTVGY